MQSVNEFKLAFGSFDFDTRTFLEDVVVDEHRTYGYKTHCPEIGKFKLTNSIRKGSKLCQVQFLKVLHPEYEPRDNAGDALDL